MLTFCNNHSTRIATAISFFEDKECGGPEGNGFHNIGWYWVEPGTCRVVYRNDVDDAGRFWYYYAEATDGTKWAGDFPHLCKERGVRPLRQPTQHTDVPAGLPRA